MLGWPIYKIEKPEPLQNMNKFSGQPNSINFLNHRKLTPLVQREDNGLKKSL